MAEAVAQSSLVTTLDTPDISTMDERASLRQEADRQAQELRERSAIMWVDTHLVFLRALNGLQERSQIQGASAHPLLGRNDALHNVSDARKTV